MDLLVLWLCLDIVISFTFTELFRKFRTLYMICLLWIFWITEFLMLLSSFFYNHLLVWMLLSQISCMAQSPGRYIPFIFCCYLRSFGIAIISHDKSHNIISILLIINDVLSFAQKWWQTFDLIQTGSAHHPWRWWWWIFSSGRNRGRRQTYWTVREFHCFQYFFLMA